MHVFIYVCMPTHIDAKKHDQEGFKVESQCVVAVGLPPDPVEGPDLSEHEEEVDLCVYVCNECMYIYICVCG